MIGEIRQNFTEASASVGLELILATALQLRDLNNKTDVTSQPIFVSKKLEQGLKSEEIKPSIVCQQCVVYKFACDLCDAVKLATH